MGTSNNCHQSSGAPNLPANDSALFSFRFYAVHPKDVRDCQLRQLFEVPFSVFWRWKSRPLGGRPQIDKEVRDLIRRMSFENPLWGAPHIHGELLKLGFDVAQSTVSKYMVPRRGLAVLVAGTFRHQSRNSASQA